MLRQTDRNVLKKPPLLSDGCSVRSDGDTGGVIRHLLPGFQNSGDARFPRFTIGFQRLKIQNKYFLDKPQNLMILMTGL